MQLEVWALLIVVALACAFSLFQVGRQLFRDVLWVARWIGRQFKSRNPN
jgi:hypothetical protein